MLAGDGQSRLFADAAFVLHTGIESERVLPGTGEPVHDSGSALFTAPSTWSASLMVWRLWPVPDLPAQFGAALSPLTLMLEDTPTGFAGVLEYAAELFDQATAARIGAQLTTLVDDATRRPLARLSELRLCEAGAEAPHRYQHRHRHRKRRCDWRCG
jgi:hypothetical protein